MGLNEEDHVLVRHALINELKNHKSDYLRYIPRGVTNLSSMFYTLQQVKVVLRLQRSGDFPWPNRDFPCPHI